MCYVALASPQAAGTSPNGYGPTVQQRRFTCGDDVSAAEGSAARKTTDVADEDPSSGDRRPSGGAEEIEQRDTEGVAETVYL